MNASLRSLSLVIGLSLSATAAAGSNALSKTRTLPMESVIGEVGPKIVGGGPASLGQQRWITSLQYFGEHFCGGALIAPDWVLTAAHCVIGESAGGSAFSVWVGGNDLRRESQGFRRDVAQIVMHPNYNDNTLRNDIALLRLSSSVPGEIAPVTLATSAVMGGAAAPNQPATASGWGTLSEGGNSPNVLHEVSLPVVSNATCNAPASYGGDVFQSMICAGLRAGGKDSCQGDSGGPLWVEANGIEYSVGITSWGEGCAQPDKYGVYTRTASFRSWVEGVTGPLGGGSGGDSGGGSGGDDGGGSGGGGGG
ncbi:MAG: serine protease, partial [Pseudomonadota bacterium]